MATVALTGGTGFVGCHVLPRLIDEGWTVRLLAGRPPVHPLWAGRSFEVVPGRLDDPSALAALVAGVDAVAHIAGLVRARSRAEFFAANAEGATALARASRAAGVRRLVLVSSIVAREPGLSDYAASKAAGEQGLAAAAAPDTWIALRPTAVYGPWDRASLAIFKAARRGAVPVVGGATASFIHVRDLAAAIAVALRTGQTGAVELDDGSAGYAWSAVMAAAAPGGARAVAVPRGLFVAAGAVAGLARLAGRAPFFSAGKARELTHPDWRRRGPELVGWRPTIGLAEGFAETAAWHRARGWL